MTDSSATKMTRTPLQWNLALALFSLFLVAPLFGVPSFKMIFLFHPQLQNMSHSACQCTNYSRCEFYYRNWLPKIGPQGHRYLLSCPPYLKTTPDTSVLSMFPRCLLATSSSLLNTISSDHTLEKKRASLLNTSSQKNRRLTSLPRASLPLSSAVIKFPKLTGRS